MIVVSVKYFLGCRIGKIFLEHGGTVKRFSEITEWH